MKMISSTSTTSTSGVMLMLDCILPGSPRRMRHLGDLEVLRSTNRHFRYLRFRYVEQTVHELGRCPIHLDMERLDLACEVVEADDGRDSDENAQCCRDQRFGDTARDYGHTARSRSRDALEGVDDTDDRTEEADEWRHGTDRGQESETALQLDQRLRQGVAERTGDELDRGDRVATGFSYSVIFEDAGRHYFRDMRVRMSPHGNDQVLNVSTVKELLEHRLEFFRLA